MSSKLHALQLDSGESFLLITTYEGNEFYILVDSGKKKGQAGKHPLVNAILKAEPSLSRINVAICTHQDGDHANGFPAFTDSWYRQGKEIGEYWLPGKWATAVPDIICDPLSFAIKLFNGAHDAAEILGNSELSCSFSEKNNFKIFEDRIRHTFKSKSLKDEYSRTVTRAQTSDNIKQNINENDIALNRLASSLGVDTDRIYELIIQEEHNLSHRRCFTNLPYYFLKNLYYPVARTHSIAASFLFNQVIETAETIRNITSAAIRHTIPIRWFDFGLFESGELAGGGIPGLISPINSIEVHRIPGTTVSALIMFLSLRLSIQNIESLVFLRNETKEEPAVLFLSDSRLNFNAGKPIVGSDFPIIIAAPKRRLVLTAPHHGSRINDNAYTVIGKWLGKDIFEHICIRSGGQGGQDFCDFLKFQHRACTNCLNSGCPDNFGRLSQQVTVITNSNDWEWPTFYGVPCK